MTRGDLIGLKSPFTAYVESCLSLYTVQYTVQTTACLQTLLVAGYIGLIADRTSQNRLFHNRPPHDRRRTRCCEGKKLGRVRLHTPSPIYSTYLSIYLSPSLIPSSLSPPSRNPAIPNSHDGSRGATPGFHSPPHLSGILQSQNTPKKNKKIVC